MITEQQIELAATGDDVFVGVWGPTEEAMYLVSESSLNAKADELKDKLTMLIVAVELAHPDSLVVLTLKEFLKDLNQ